MAGGLVWSGTAAIGYQRAIPTRAWRKATSYSHLRARSSTAVGIWCACAAGPARNATTGCSSSRTITPGDRLKTRISSRKNLYRLRAAARWSKSQKAHGRFGTAIEQRIEPCQKRTALQPRRKKTSRAQERKKKIRISTQALVPCPPSFLHASQVCRTAHPTKGIGCTSSNSMATEFKRVSITARQPY